MNITENLVIAEEPNERLYPGRPYFLCIAGYGPVGDKLNMGAGYTGSRFPIDAAERFADLGEAVESYYKFLYYVNDKITQAKKLGFEDKKRPSYYLWT